MKLISLRTLLGTMLVIAAASACSDSSTAPTPPTAPSGLTLQQLSLTSIRVSWTAVSGAGGYLLERASAASPGVFTHGRWRDAGARTS